jgi:probable F420-dependent oxidoreductase
MSKLQLGSVGVALNVSADDAWLKDAAELEGLGYATIWLPGGQIDTLDRVTQVIGATRAVPVGTGIIPPDVYPAAAVARLYAQLEASAPGRFVVGLGAPQQARAFQPLNDYLDQLDRAEPPVPRHQRILAALGPRKLELARDRFAGAIPLLVTPAYTAAARQILGEDATLVISQMAVLGTDAAKARQAARKPLRFLSGVRGYRANFARMGFADAEIAGLGDRLVDELVTWGDSGSIATRVREHLAAGADQVTLTFIGEDDPLPVEAARQLAAELL